MLNFRKLKQYKPMKKGGGGGMSSEQRAYMQEQIRQGQEQLEIAKQSLVQQQEQFEASKQQYAETQANLAKQQKLTDEQNVANQMSRNRAAAAQVAGGSTLAESQKSGNTSQSVLSTPFTGTSQKAGTLGKVYDEEEETED